MDPFFHFPIFHWPQNEKKSSFFHSRQNEKSQNEKPDGGIRKHEKYIQNSIMVDLASMLLQPDTFSHDWIGV